MGWNAKQIADHLGRSIVHVRNTARNMGIKLTPIPRSRKLTFENHLFTDACARGLTLAEAAAEIGCDLATVRLREKELGLSFSRTIYRQPGGICRPSRPKPIPKRNTGPMSMADYAALENEAMRRRDQC